MHLWVTIVSDIQRNIIFFIQLYGIFCSDILQWCHYYNVNDYKNEYQSKKVLTKGLHHFLDTVLNIYSFCILTPL